MSDRSPELNELAKALSDAQGEFTTIPKGDFNPFYKSKYAGLPDVIETAAPVLARHGLSVSQHLGFDGTHDLLTTYLMHSSGQFIAESMRLHLVKEDPQGHGSATTYARRYSYMSALGLVADEDDDGNRANPQSTRPAAAARPAKTTVRRTPSVRPEPPEPDMPVNVTGAPEMINMKQLSMLHALFNQKGMHDRNERLAYVNGKGFDVESSKDLTKADASRVIDALQAEDAQS
jgi:hypothetical protein